MQTALREPRKAFGETFSGEGVILGAFFETCPLCVVGDTPFKMKRQTVHHIPAAGKIVVCVEATLKPTS